MSTLALVSIISLLGWLVLALSSYRSQQVPRGKTIKIILLWIGIFAGVSALFGALT